MSATAVAAAALAACSRGSSQPNVDVGALRALYPDPDGVAQVGKYAVKVPSVGDQRRTVAAALSPNGRASGLGDATAPELRSHLRTAIAGDFAKNRVVDVAGWQLPLTEARIAALLYLSR